LAAIGLAIALSGCLTSNARTVFDEPTLRPGDNVTCAANPCTVYFETPAGSGTHDILQNGTIKAGVATGGVRVKLGEYFGGSTVFHVQGTELPKAYLTVPSGE
jgi:hypothetical protein